MTRINEDKIREERISMEIVIDAYGVEERCVGWYYNLESKLRFPFRAECIATRTSPLIIGADVEVTKMAPEAAYNYQVAKEGSSNNALRATQATSYAGGR